MALLPALVQQGHPDQATGLVLPLVFASGVYSTARNIMGVALVGGMLFATLLGIFVYPALYYFVGRIGGFERRRERKKQEEKL